MEGRHLTLEEINQAERQLQGSLKQIKVTEKFSISQSIISRLRRRFREIGSPVVQHPCCGRCTTAI